MSRQPGGAPPPPPPVPPHQLPPVPTEAPPNPPRRGPGDSPRAAVVGPLAVALAVSLAVNAILALRVKDESDQQARERARVAQLQAEVEALRRQSPPGGASLVARISAAVEQLRELSFKKDVKPEVLTDEQLAARVEQQFRTDNPRAEVDANDDVLTTLGLLAPRDDLYQILLDVHREQIGGFYDTEKKVLVVGGDAANPTPLDQVLLSHELVHAVTDQHYGLQRVDKLQDARKDDEALAFLALVEGDATVTMFRYAERYLTPSQRAEVDREAGSGSTDKLLAAPPVIREALLFPYQHGERFARSIFTSGGITVLNRAYQDPPTSTEQILHPSKYLNRRDDPTAVEMPNLAAAMGSGWKAIEGGGVGEFDVQLLVDQFLSGGDARDAAAGWDGGRYAATQSSAGTVVAVQTVWDSESEARQATSILGRWLPSRFQGRGNDVRIASGRGWESSDGAGVVIRSGARMILILGPDRASVERARKAFSGF